MSKEQFDNHFKEIVEPIIDELMKQIADRYSEKEKQFMEVFGQAIINSTEKKTIDDNSLIFSGLLSCSTSFYISMVASLLSGITGAIKRSEKFTHSDIKSEVEKDLIIVLNGVFEKEGFVIRCLRCK